MASGMFLEVSQHVFLDMLHYKTQCAAKMNELVRVSETYLPWTHTIHVPIPLSHQEN